MKKQRIVVKIGSSSLTNSNGSIDEAKISEHVQAISLLKKAGHEMILITSGAVAAGFSSLGYPSRPVTIKGKQAAAAVGQTLLMQQYMNQFKQYALTPGQILLTRNDFSKRERYRNAYATIMELLERGVIPIINENDSTSVEELTFGDNDMLSALVSGLIHADQLMILTDINGLYDANPNENPEAKRFDYLPEITSELLGYAGTAGSKVGTGGMKSKLLAAQTALSLGVKVFIGTGSGEQKLADILDGRGDGTYIGDKELSSVNNTRQWIQFHSPISGEILIDAGAEEAMIHNGSSLLPAGVVGVKGNFPKGAVVEVRGPGGVIGKGQTHYSSEEIMEARGKRSDELGFERTFEVIHRNDWVNLKD
ncbi:glutamate 5-kinase [Bacillus cabrialesii]|uniref:Glutamate 5-kinase n=1 Tax=Bacillus cabrialesii subsp. tritici TaxID=2944916 RepID=A0ABT9DIZ5_9BACI|nr:glutamate 5-kinase [Bacillus cabrialesii]MDO8224665.1 glutamate 5-kinase [Bacillus cabrialesii subsp. tritici]